MNKTLLWVTLAVSVATTLHLPAVQAETSAKPSVVVEDASLARVVSKIQAGCTSQGWLLLEARSDLVVCGSKPIKHSTADAQAPLSSQLIMRFELAAAGADTRVSLNPWLVTVRRTGANVDEAQNGELYDAAVKFLQSLAD